MKTDLKYKKAGIVAKPHIGVALYLKKAVDILSEWGVEVILEKIAAELLGTTSEFTRTDIVTQADIIILIGGDGTFLSVATKAVEHEIPVGGFNLGTLGFLTELNKETMKESLDMIFSGKSPMSERKLLSIGFKGETYIALNDVVASKGNIARIIKFRLEIDHEHVAEFSGDGIIIASPTGSTAYSLSSGGPIIAPKVNGFVITPICPHSLTIRPLIVPDNSHISITLLSENTDVFLTVDGQTVIPMDAGDHFEISLYPKALKMITNPNMNYFKLLNEKLNWGL